MVAPVLPIGLIIAFSPLELSCTSKQAPGCPYSQHNAHDRANCEINGARIEQNLKCVTHFRSSDPDGIAAPLRSAALKYPSRGELRAGVALAVGYRTKTKSKPGAEC